VISILVFQDSLKNQVKMFISYHKHFPSIPLIKILTVSTLQDVHMPEMDGLQATKLIRSFENTGCWDVSVKPEDNPMITDSAISSDSAHAKKQGQRVPIIAVSLQLH
jgi:CheY-like chemotaxis protein